jgi:hypothetical protein
MDGNNWADFKEGTEPDPVRLPRHRNPLMRLLNAADLFDAELAFHGPGPPHRLVDTLRLADHLGRYPDPHASRAAAE